MATGSLAETTADAEQMKLSAYERRLWIEVDRILYQNYLTPRTVTDFWGGDRHAVIAHLKQMKERVIRTIVVVEYVELDDLLNRTISKHLLGRRPSKTAKKNKTLRDMLDRLYPQQKIDIIREFKNVPGAIYNHVMGLNTLRNSLAHRFHLGKLPKSKRLYKGKHDLFTKKGLDQFKSDMWEVQEFFQPEIAKASLQLVTHQRERNLRNVGTWRG